MNFRILINKLIDSNSYSKLFQPCVVKGGRGGTIGMARVAIGDYISGWVVRGDYLSPGWSGCDGEARHIIGGSLQSREHTNVRWMKFSLQIFNLGASKPISASHQKTTGRGSLCVLTLCKIYTFRTHFY